MPRCWQRAGRIAQRVDFPPVSAHEDLAGQDDAQAAMASGVSKNRDYLGLLLRLTVSEGPQGDEEGRRREPCTRCPLKRPQRWWEKGN